MSTTALPEAPTCPGGSLTSPAATRDERITYLAAFTGAVAGGQQDQFDPIVKAAYHAGASREDLLAAVEVARVLGDASGPTIVQAYVVIHTWRWIEARRTAARRAADGPAA